MANSLPSAAAQQQLVMKVVIVGESGVGKSALTFRFIDNVFFEDGVSTLGVDFKYTTVEVDLHSAASGNESGVYGEGNSNDGSFKEEGGGSYSTPQRPTGAPSSSAASASNDSSSGNKVPVKLQVWDTAGQEAFANLVNSFYRGSNAVMLCFDLTCRDSFEALEKWLERVRTQLDASSSPLPMLLLVGCKFDLVEADVSPSYKPQPLSDNENADAAPTVAASRRQVSSAEACAWAAEHGAMCYFETSAKENSNVREAFEYLALNFAKKQQDLNPSVGGGGSSRKAPSVALRNAEAVGGEQTGKGGKRCKC